MGVPIRSLSYSEMTYISDEDFGLECQACLIPLFLLASEYQVSSGHLHVISSM